MKKLEFESPKITIIEFSEDAIRTSGDDIGVWSGTWGGVIR